MAVLTTLPAVPIAAVGTWQTSTGEWVCTAEQLASAVTAGTSNQFRSPVLKLGHDDPRFDAEPAVGRLENLRLSGGGQTLLADLVGVPAWLAEIAASAYPSRSIECLLGVTSADGTTWPMVVTGLALLGVTAPAVETLADLADLYGVSRDVEDYVAARRVAASALPPEEAPMPRALGQVVDTPPRMVAASASIDELSTAAEDWAETQPMLGRDCWVRDIFTDVVIFTCWMGDDCQYFRVPWTETDGVFTFGEAVQVRPTYEPVPMAMPAGGSGSQMAASGVTWVSSGTRERVLRNVTPGAVPSPRGRAVVAGEQPKETHVPISPALAAALGVGEDADDETALAALEKLRTPVVEPPGPNQQEGGTTTTAPDLEQLVAAAMARELPKATAPILASLATTSTELAEMKAEKAKTVKDGVIGGAVTAGKIKPADRETWAKRYDDAPGVITEVLASLAPGTAVPIAAAGRTGGEESGSDEALYAQLYGAAEEASV